MTTNLATNKNHAGFWDRQSTDLKMLWWRTSHWYSIDWSSKSLWYKKPWNPFKKIECNRFMCKDAPFRSFLSGQTYWVHINRHFETVFLKNVPQQCHSHKFLIGVGGDWFVILSYEYNKNRKNVSVMLVFDYRLIVLFIEFIFLFFFSF